MLLAALCSSLKPTQMKKLFLLVSPLMIALFGCTKEAPQTPKPAPKTAALSDVEYLHQAQTKLRDLVVNDIFSPPVASRVYVYPLLAAYEAGRFSEPNSNSLTAKLNGFDAMPIPEAGKTYHFTLAALKALCTVAPKLIFSKKDLEAYEQETLNALKATMAPDVYERSLSFGQQVAAVILKRMATDNYNETRGMERFEVKAKVPGRWVPTPPDYADGVEPHWAKMKPLALKAANQFAPPPPPKYSEDKNSPFWKEVVEVYEAVNKITPEQDEIVVFWDDNPFVSRHKGHLMFQDKKMTPGGHWLAISQLMMKTQKRSFYQALHTYALTAIALYDAFISCWEAKYTTVLLRPETVISAKLDPQWHPYLVTPPFPAYTSGHSTVSAAAAEVLTQLLGDHIAFTDTTQKEYGLPIRTFKSFHQAALEASMSRLYAGIHYRSDCEQGNKQGTKLGRYIAETLK